MSGSVYEFLVTLFVFGLTYMILQCQSVIGVVFVLALNPTPIQTYEFTLRHLSRQNFIFVIANKC